MGADTPAQIDLPALVELRAIAKSLGLMAEPLLDAAPNNGQARRRERDDLIVNLRRAEGRVLDAMQAIRVALTLQRDQEATARAEAERIVKALVGFQSLYQMNCHDSAPGNEHYAAMLLAIVDDARALCDLPARPSVRETIDAYFRTTQEPPK